MSTYEETVQLREGINDIARRIHKENRKWWVDLETDKPKKRAQEEIFILIISEIIECMEGERKDLQDTHLPHRKSAEVEMADAAIRILDWAGAYNIELDVSLVYPINVVFNYPPEFNTKQTQLLGMIANVTRMPVYLGEFNPHDLIHPVWLYESATRLLLSIEAYCKLHGYDLWKAVREKQEYNTKRPDHQIENRKKKGGKKW